MNHHWGRTTIYRPLSYPFIPGLKWFIDYGKTFDVMRDIKYRIIQQGGRGHLAVYYTSPQSLIMLGRQLWGLLLNFDWLVY